MEDLKKYLAILAKHSFWILTGLVLILSAVFFYLTKSSLDQSIEARKSTLKSTFEKIRGVEGKVSTHPNDHSHKEMEKLLNGLKGDVDQAWEFQYARQKEFLTWPSEAFYLEKTRKVFEGLSPFEGIVPFPIPTPAPAPMDAITRNDRTVYKNYIAPEFPNLARRIGSTWKFELDPSKVVNRPGAGKFGMGGAGDFSPDSDNRSGAMIPMDETRDLVRWPVESQEALAAGVLPWFNRAEPPDIHEIYYAQEDIWILRGLMDIIAKTNAGSKENFQAIVKEIEWIVTGPRATRDAGTLWNTMIARNAGGSGGFGTGAFSGKATDGGGRSSGMGKFDDSTVKVDSADGRYVDANLKPLTGAQLRSAIQAKTPDAVAKRVQVRMRLKVDERFGRLITECGNGKMMLEVLQVRYNTPSAMDSLSSGGSGFGGGGRAGSGLKKGMASGEGVGQNEDLSGSSASARNANANSGEVSIEIYGLIYLFNPPSNLSEKAASPAEDAATATTNGADEASNVPEPAPTTAPPATQETDPPPPAAPSAGEPDPSSPEARDTTPPPADAPASDGGGPPADAPASDGGGNP
jgi:hypothetical protein